MFRIPNEPILRIVAPLIVLAGVAVTPSVAGAHTGQLGAPSEAGPSPTIECPVDGSSEFVDSWGAPRSGGRRHQGVDMAAPRGTPVAAAATGFAEFTSSNFGGNAIWLTTQSGDKFYYAHLDAWEGDSRDVSAGDIIGYVGSTGNARGDHLHFESHPNGVPANPYPAVATGCAAGPLDDAELLAARQLPGNSRLS